MKRKVDLNTSDIYKILKKENNLKLGQSEFRKLIQKVNKAAFEECLKNPYGVILPYIGTLSLEGKKGRKTVRGWSTLDSSQKKIPLFNDNTDGVLFRIRLFIDNPKNGRFYGFRLIRKGKRELAKRLKNSEINYELFKTKIINKPKKRKENVNL